MGKKIKYHTLGCKLNFAETSAIGKMLEERGYERAVDNETADVCIINTCSVTDTADHKCRQAVNHMHRKNPGAKIIVTGCYAQLKPEEIAALDGVDLVLGMEEKLDIEKYIRQIESDSNESNIEHTATGEIEKFYASRSYEDRTRCFLKIQDGCDYFCTYCTIPYARGKSRSGEMEQIIEEARTAAKDGMKEIILTGVNLGDYGRGTGSKLIDLLKKLDETESIERYRISSIEPNLLRDEIIDFVAQSKTFAPHFHIPLQSGSNEVLKLMSRRYKREVFKEKVEKIRATMPDAFIGVDVIVGTRGEREEYFNDSRDFIESLPISQLHVFSYSEREGTKALDIEYTVSQEEKKRRSEVLHEISERKLKSFYGQNIGKIGKVLWEESRRGKTMHGFTENYIRVSSPYDTAKVNTIQEVRLGDFDTNDKQIALKATLK